MQGDYSSADKEQEMGFFQEQTEDWLWVFGAI